MTGPALFDIFLVTAPGLESALAGEALEKGFDDPRPQPGGVTLRGGWPEVWRANLELRGAARVLARLASFPAAHLSQLDKRARKLDWAAILRPDGPVKVEASCKKSRIYHSGAAAERVETAIAQTMGVPIADDAPVRILVRIENNLCTISVDTSGEPLHKRGHKQAVNVAPMRENLAALFLRQCGFDPAEPLVDPMCGSGTFVIEAAEIAAGLQPGRSRNFAFEHLTTFDADAWQQLQKPAIPVPPVAHFFGSDRDAGAIRMSAENADRAGVRSWTRFAETPVAELNPPDGPPGLVIVNPPYGTRIGNKKKLLPLYATLGRVLAARFKGWRVGLITSEKMLADATRLPFTDPLPSVDNAGLRVRLYRTKPL